MCDEERRVAGYWGSALAKLADVENELAVYKRAEILHDKVALNMDGDDFGLSFCAYTRQAREEADPPPEVGPVDDTRVTGIRFMTAGLRRKVIDWYNRHYP